VVAGALALGVCLPTQARAATSVVRGKVRIWTVHYRAHNGARRAAHIALPRWYGPRHNPVLPLVISPHGRGVSGRMNLALWGQLPALGGFAVVSPDGQGRLLSKYSWGAAGQIDDLARMPQIVRRTLPWLRIDMGRVYAIGGSMGGQEVLLLLARHKRLLAGVAAFDAVTDFARQYREFPRLACRKSCRKAWDGPVGRALQHLAQEELGGPPRRARRAFELRSPLTYARAIASSCVPLQLWWSPKDEIVIGQQYQSGRLFAMLKHLAPGAPLTGFTGGWRHSAEMRASTRLPLALARFDLLPYRYDDTRGLRVLEPPVAVLPTCAA
jgi:pimeloyl-ACP methyl ester carboxylesterase